MKRKSLEGVAALVAVCSLLWLVDNVNIHGNHLAAGFEASLKGFAAYPAPVTASSFDTPPNTVGLDLIDMYECSWGPPLPDIGGWVGLWLVTAVVGGLPTAVLIRRT